MPASADSGVLGDESAAPAPDAAFPARAWAFFTRYVDLKMAVLGAIALGGAVFAINYLDHGWVGASTAAAKQALYTFFVGGFVTRTSERFATRGEHKWPAVGLGAVVSASIAVGLTFLLHSMRGTPEPVLSTLPTLLSAPPALIVWGLRKRAAFRGDRD